MCTCVSLLFHDALIITLYLVSRGSLGSLCLKTKHLPLWVSHLSHVCAHVCGCALLEVRRVHVLLSTGQVQKETVEKYHNKSVPEGETAAMFLRWSI